MSKPKPRVAIIGAGLAGLYAAIRLHPRCNVSIYERSKDVGGRIKSVRHKNGLLDYDTGAWRISENHTRMMKLAKQYNINLEPCYSQPFIIERPFFNIASTECEAGYSLKDCLALKHNIVNITMMELNSTHIGTMDGERRTYRLTQDAKMFTHSTGMQIFIDKLYDEVTRLGIPIHTESLVETIEKVHRREYQSLFHDCGYRLGISKRSGKDEFKRDVQIFDGVLFCGLPNMLPQTNFQTQLAPLCASIGTVPLCHVYLSTTEDIQPIYRYTDDLLGQVIAISKRKLMLYSGGWLSEFHFRSHMKDKQKYIQYLKNLLTRVDPSLVLKIDFTSLKVCYHKHAVGYHKVTPSKETIDEKVLKFVIPHATKLPNFCVCTEAVSSECGWGEGSLETVDIAVEYLFRDHQVFRLRKTIPPHSVVYDGRIIYIKQFYDMHPGSRSALENHIRQNVTRLIHLIHHNSIERVLRYILSYQSGYFIENQS